MKPGTDVAIFVDFVWEIFPPGNRESLARKKFGSAREQADAIDAMPLGFRQQSLHQAAASALTLCPRPHGDGTNLSQVRAVKVQRPASNDAAFVFENHEVSY